jgi:L-idonate 5-dehydrogenase
VQGAFAEVFLADQTQCVPIGESLPYAKAACAEPLAVALHAVKRAGNLLGKRVLIAGAGPIGLLVLMVARLAGAAKVVLTDQFQEPLETACRLGADQIINIAEVEQSTRELADLAGTFDIAIEAAGAFPALSSCLTSVRAGGRIVQLGILPDKGDERFRLSMLTTREIELVGSFRFFDEYETAVELLRSKMVDPSLIVTAEIPIAEAETAFLLASDRKKALKVCLPLRKSLR